MRFVHIAAICHEANRVLCEQQGDWSQVPWHMAPEWQKKSAIDGVKLHVLNNGITPEDSHKNWLAEKERDGWRYGVVKDEGRKTHPCMVPYDQLPEKQKAKDHLFKAVCDGLRPFCIESMG